MTDNHLFRSRILLLGVVFGVCAMGDIEKPGSRVSKSDPNLVLKISGEAPVLDGDVSKEFWRDSEWTHRFDVLDKAGPLFGSFVGAGDEFVANAARAALACVDGTLYLAVDCPVPAGVEYALTATADGAGIWGDDGIELFLQPDSSEPAYFQYLVNAEGFKRSIKYASAGSAGEDFESAARAAALRGDAGFGIELAVPLAELGVGDIGSATDIRFNVTRCGPTAGGLSTWAPVGENFHTPSRFGKLLVGSRGANLSGQLEEILEAYAGMEADPVLKGSLKPRFDALEERIRAYGDDPARWDALRGELTNLRNGLKRLALDGKPFLLWRGAPWENRRPNAAIPAMADPLDRVRLRTARNGKAIYGFAFTNLEDFELMARAKILTDPPPENIAMNRSPEAGTDAATLAARTVFKEGLAMQDKSSQTIPDPLAPLILNSIIRCAPGATTPLWMEIDARGLEAGVYKAMVRVAPVYRGLPAQSFKLELEVVDVDLREARNDTFTYTYLWQRKHKKATSELYRDYGFTYIYCGSPGSRSLRINPRFDKDGNVVREADFSQLDERIEQGLAGGIPPDEMKLFFYMGYNYPWWRGLYYDEEVKTQLEFGTPEWRKGFAAWMAQLKSHLAGKYGIPLSRVVFNPVDEPEGDPDEPGTKMHWALESCRLIKEAEPEVRTMLNPMFNKYKDRERQPYIFNRLAEHTDIIEFCRPHITSQPHLPGLAREAGDFEFWTYHVLRKHVDPVVFRRMYWQNRANDFTSIVAFWHLDQHAGGDGLNSLDGGERTTDYGAVYSDEDSDRIITSRRLEAWYQGQIDFALLKLCAEYAEAAAAGGADVETETRRLESILREGLEANMPALETLQEELLSLAAILKEKAE